MNDIKTHNENNQEAKEFLRVLKKAMNEEGIPQRIEGYNEVIEKVKSGLLNGMLKESTFPDTPAVSEKLDDALDKLEFQGFIKELSGKRPVILSFENNQNGFEFLKKQKLENINFNNILYKSNNKVPLILYKESENSNEKNYIFAINYADIKIAFSLEEYKILTEGSEKFSIDLSEIINFFFFGENLNDYDSCYILTNKNFKNIAKYVPVISGIYSINSTYYQKIFDCGNETYIKEEHSHPLSNLKNELDNKNNEKNFLYSFKTEFEYALVGIDSYYKYQIERRKKMHKAITIDLSQDVSEGENDTLNNYRKKNDEQLNLLIKEYDSYNIIKDEIFEACKKIDIALFGENTTSLEFCNQQLNNVLRIFFEYADNKIKKESEICIDLIKEHCTQFDVSALKFYLENSLGENKKETTIDIDEKNFSSETLWAASKIQISSDYGGNTIKENNHSENSLKNIVDANMLIDTEKEYLALALTKTDSKEKTKLLKKSFSMKSKIAGDILFKEAINNNDEDEIYFLASGLMDQACLRIANSYNIKNNSDEAGYLKVAACCGNFDAKKQIVEILFKEGYSGQKFMGIKNLKSKKEPVYSDILIDLCQEIIRERLNPAKYSEYLGIIYFSKEAYSLAFRHLRGGSSSEALLAKAYMYEYGKGTTEDIEKAAYYYKKCYDKSNWKRAFNAYIKLEKKISENEIEDEETYDESEDYSADYTLESDSGGCFITTAACRALKAKDNCDELEMLRNFRDKHILNSDNGELLVYEYYRVGPLIVNAIESQPNPGAIYDYLWDNYIYPSCLEIKNREWKSAKEIYIKMVKALCKKFNITVDRQINEMYSYL